MIVGLTRVFLNVVQKRVDILSVYKSFATEPVCRRIMFWFDMVQEKEKGIECVAMWI
jgi:hypothetical protein